VTVATSYGPNSLLVEEVLARARRLDEAEGSGLLEANRRLLVTNHRLSAALRDVVYAGYRFGREDEMARAERVGRGTVRLFPGTRRQLALAGMVGRLCETLVVVELIPLESRDLLLAAWRAVIDDRLGAGLGSPYGR